MKFLKYLAIAIIILLPCYYIFVQISGNDFLRLYNIDVKTEAEKNLLGEDNGLPRDETLRKDILNEEVLSEEELMELYKLFQEDQALLEQEIQYYLEEQIEEEKQLSLLNEPLKLNVRDLIADASEYESRRVVVGPLIINGNNVERKSLRTNALNVDGETDYDARLEIFYVDLPDSDTKWRYLYIDLWENLYIDSVEGTFHMYRDSENKGFIKAEKIVFRN